MVETSRERSQVLVRVGKDAASHCYTVKALKRISARRPDAVFEMSKFLALFIVIGVVSVAASVKEWKNFENGKVYSHKTPNEKKTTVKAHGFQREPVVEERLLHSHHKKTHHQLKSNRMQADTKEYRSKNPERHHKKNIEEEMHLKPLNERHHKFPNPALLDKSSWKGDISPQISKQKLIKQVSQNIKSNKGKLEESG